MRRSAEQRKGHVSSDGEENVHPAQNCAIHAMEINKTSHPECPYQITAPAELERTLNSEKVPIANSNRRKRSAEKSRSTYV